MDIFCSLFLFLLFFFVVNFTKKRKLGLLSTINVFIGFWAIVVFGGLFHLYGLYKISEYVYLLTLIGCISYVIGYMICTQPKGSCRTADVQEIEPKGGFFTPLMYIVLIASVFLIYKQIDLLLPIILRNGMAEARGAYGYDEDLHLEGIWDILISYFARPFIKATLYLLIIDLFWNGVKWFKLLLILFLMMVYFFSEGGRSFIMDYVFATIYLFYICKNNISPKIRTRIKQILLLLVTLPIFATLERRVDVFFSIYTYYCGALQFLSQIIEKKADLFTDNLYGMCCFQGFAKPFFGFLEQLGIEKPDLLVSSNSFILSMQDTVLDIGPNCPMNYFATCFGYAYRDGGIIGIILIMVSYGYISAYVDYKERQNQKDLRWTGIKLVFFTTVFFTMSYFPFAKYLNAMIIIYIILISKYLCYKK